MRRSPFSFDDLGQWSRSFGFELDGRQILQLKRYLDSLLFWNRRSALVSQTHADEIVCKHFADSLAVLPIFHSGDAAVDIGSGAGFPGLVIAIARPDITMNLIDSNRKKISFLAETIRTIGIVNVQPLEGRAESLAVRPDHCGRYNLAISRAFSTIADILSLARPFLRVGGRAIAMKGPNYLPDLETADLSATGFYLIDTIPYLLPDASRRFSVCFKMI